MKQMGARNAGNPHVACDVEGAGDVERSRYFGRPARQSSTLLKDNHGGRTVRVRGPAKVMCHLMFGILSFTVLQLVRLVT